MTPRQAQTAILALCILVALVVALRPQGIVWLVLTAGAAYFFANTSQWHDNGQRRWQAFVAALLILLTWVAVVLTYVVR